MRKTIAIDFDGCLCKEAWPEIGAPNLNVIGAAIREKQNGAALILWTCRTGSLLDAAVQFCREHGLEFDAVNENLTERIELYGSDCRKVGADEYWDDRAVHMPAINTRKEQECQGENDPLTLDELRKMDGEPVFTVHGAIGKWSLVDAESEQVRNANGFVKYFSLYGNKWLAYRYKPKES